MYFFDFFPIPVYSGTRCCITLPCKFYKKHLLSRTLSVTRNCFFFCLLLTKSTRSLPKWLYAAYMATEPSAPCLIWSRYSSRKLHLTESIAVGYTPHALHPAIKKPTVIQVGFNSIASNRFHAKNPPCMEARQAFTLINSRLHALFSPSLGKLFHDFQLKAATAAASLCFLRRIGSPAKASMPEPNNHTAAGKGTGCSVAGSLKLTCHAPPASLGAYVALNFMSTSHPPGASQLVSSTLLQVNPELFSMKLRPPKDDPDGLSEVNATVQ